MMSVHHLLLLLGLTALLHNSDARGHHGLGHGHHHHLASAAPPQTHHHLASAAPPQTLPVYDHHHHGIAPSPQPLRGPHGQGHGHYRHGSAASSQPLSAKHLILEEKCNQTRFPEFCIMAAFQYGHNYTHIDNMAMLDMMISGLFEGSRMSIRETSRILADDKTPNPVAKNIKECAAGYVDALNNLKGVKPAIAKGDHGTVLTYLSAVLDNVGRCLEVFQERPTAEKNPMEVDSQILIGIASSSLSFTYLAFGIPHP